MTLTRGGCPASEFPHLGDAAARVKARTNVDRLGRYGKAVGIKGKKGWISWMW